MNLRRSSGITILLLACLGCGDRADQHSAGPSGPPPEHAASAAPTPVNVAPFAMVQPDMVLLVTGGTHGRMEVCNCSGPMAGGLSRRSGLVVSYRHSFPRVLLVDTGDLFWIRPADAVNKHLLPAYRAIGYDALALGDHEFMAMPDPLTKYLRDTPLTYLLSAPTGDLPVKPALIYRAGDQRLAVVSCLGEGALGFAPVRPATDLPALQKQIDKLKADGCAVVLVAHTDESELADLAGLAGVDLVLQGHTARTESAVLRLGEIPMLKVGGPEHVGAVALKLARGRIADLEFRAEVVDTRWPLDRRIMSYYQGYAHEAMRLALDGAKKLTLEYVPSSACGKCHADQYRAWTQDRHSQAWQTLVVAERTYDPNCLMCHTSGFATARGFHTIKDTPQLANVNCQDCHRHNLKPQPVMINGKLKGHDPTAKTVDEATCTICHTPINSPKFDYKLYRPYVCCTWAKSGQKPTSRPAR